MSARYDLYLVVDGIDIESARFLDATDALIIAGRWGERVVEGRLDGFDARLEVYEDGVRVLVDHGDDELIVRAAS